MRHIKGKNAPNETLVLQLFEDGKWPDYSDKSLVPPYCRYRDKALPQVETYVRKVSPICVCSLYLCFNSTYSGEYVVGLFQLYRDTDHEALRVHTHQLYVMLGS